ncbi:MAG: hypothetical protein JNJ88_09945 [Planctomycetes bacterium]|nr:hypothetical protein [Planctomycetota bacterium]
MTAGLSHSVHVRLVQHAKRLGIDPNVVLVRYGSKSVGFTTDPRPIRSRPVSMKMQMCANL